VAKTPTVDDPQEEPIEVVADAVEETAPEEQVDLPEPVEPEEGEAYVSPMLVAAESGERVVFPMPQSEQGAAATEG
jgi:hypothetical protein